jgi:hypothetical protein
MIEITITLHSAVTRQARGLYRLEIVNDETGTLMIGNYLVSIYQGDSPARMACVAVPNIRRDQGIAIFLQSCIHAVEFFLQ